LKDSRRKKRNHQEKDQKEGLWDQRRNAKERGFPKVSVKSHQFEKKGERNWGQRKKNFTMMGEGELVGTNGAEGLGAGCKGLMEGKRGERT